MNADTDLRAVLAGLVRAEVERQVVPSKPEPRQTGAGKRGRAAALEQRMLRHRSVYNAGALLRDAWHGSEARRAEWWPSPGGLLLFVIEDHEVN